MANIVLKPEEVPAELAQVLVEIEAGGKKKTCDFPGCGRPHQNVAIRMAQPKAIDLLFCSDVHRVEAAERWGLKI
jgi:hypothetical protein